jgi:hypothetical protein
MLMSLMGLRSEKGCSGHARQKLKVQTRFLVREGAHINKLENVKKIIIVRMGKVGRRSQMGACRQDGLAV